MIRRRRPPPLRRALPWLAAFLFIAGTALWIGSALRRSDAALVARADAVRAGDLEKDVQGDPGAALELLAPLLERNPEHFEANFTAARAWADLRSWENAIAHLERAGAAAAELRDRVRAERQIVLFLTLGQQHDEAIERARGIIDLQPGNPVLPLQYAISLYDASVAAQQAVTARFVAADKDVRDVEIERRIEAFVTDIWGSPDVDELVASLVPRENPSLRQEVRDELLLARERLLQAAESMEAYRSYAGFDSTVAKGWVELLLRTGRVFDAHVEAGIALRQKIPVGLRRSFLEVQAAACEIVGEHEQAAALYQQIVDGFLSLRDWCPSRYLDALAEARLRAGHWDWILAHERDQRRMLGKDTAVLDWAVAEAHAARGDGAAALKAIDQTFRLVAFGSLVPRSVRSDPERRRGILALGYRLFREAGDDGTALLALDGLLDMFPGDLEARRERVALNRAMGRLEGARDDAFDLLVADRRDHEDFELWLATSEEVSLHRTGRSLAERATEVVEQDRSLRQSLASAAVLRPQRGLAIEAAAFTSPALAWSVVRERILHNDLERARVELRRLCESHPGVQEFRYQLARLLVREGRLGAAVDELLAVLDAVPRDTESLDLTLRLQSALGRHREAARLVNTMILADPLGVGAVRVGSKLLETNRAGATTDLLKRLMRWEGFEPGLDVHIMAARAALAQGDLVTANELLRTASESHSDSADVALLGVELGLAQRDQSLLDAALAHLQPMSAGLFPDQVERVCELLLAAGRPDGLLALFPPEVRHLPVLQRALRPLAAAAKAAGRFDEADELLARAHDAESLRDRFLLLAMQGRAEEASRRLRLAAIEPGTEDEVRLCLLVADALAGFGVLVDATPTARLRELGMEDELQPGALELLDAALRLAPRVRRLEDVVPQAVVTDPVGTYPRAGADVARLVELARRAPSDAAAVARALVLALLTGERPFWQRELQALGEQVLARIPGLRRPALYLAGRQLSGGRPQEVLPLLKPLLDPARPDLEALEILLEAAPALDKESWALALAAASEERDLSVKLLLAEALARWGNHAEALPRFKAVLDEHPEERRSLAGMITAQAALKVAEGVTALAGKALRAHPEDDVLAQACIDALVSLPRPDGEALALLEQLAGRHGDSLRLPEALARGHAQDGEVARRWLDELATRADALVLPLGSAEARDGAAVLRRAATFSHELGELDRARRLHELALLFEPAVVVQFAQVADLELSAGRLDVARRYLEVLAIVHPADKDPPLRLADLLFSRLGQPHRAADVIRRSFGRSAMPPKAVEVLAAEAYLRGDVEAALQAFQKMRYSPHVSPEMMLTVAHVAFAAQRDDTAAFVFDMFLTSVPKDHPLRPRAHLMWTQCKPADKTTDEPPPDADPTATARVTREG